MPSEPTLKLIHEDSRGEMYQILLPTGQEIMLLHSKAGAVRGGHSHTADEMVAIVSGSLEYHKIHRNGAGTSVVYRAGSGSHNLKGVAHYGEFLEDSWLLEFKYGPNSAVGEWQNVDYEPFRKLVRGRMEAKP